MKKILLSLIIFSVLAPALVSGQTVVCGNGTAISVFSPINRTNDYCVYEVIYLQNQIGIAGTISTLGFQRHDGTDTATIENVNIYLKHTSNLQLSAGTFDTTGYTLVYSGTFPNDLGAGWREVALNGAFTYNNINNLQVLVEKGYQPQVANTPVTVRWIYTNTGTPHRARRYYGDIPISSATALTTTNFTSNARLTLGSTGVVELQDFEVKVYPNPSAGEINFLHNFNSDEVNLKMFDVAGHEVINQQIERETTLNIENLSPGLYFYSVYSTDFKSDYKGKVVITR